MGALAGIVIGAAVFVVIAAAVLIWDRLEYGDWIWK